MLRSLKRLFEGDAAERPAHERRHLELAVAVLLHEARRADYAEAHERESGAAEQALMEIFSLGKAEAAALLGQAHARAQTLTSLYAPLAVVKREYGQEERIRLVEQLWRVAFADGLLNPYEDHYVRKVAHLLYVPNTQAMLARNRARGGG